jgi:putative salt-induced outer membrane protein YdiY
VSAAPPYRRSARIAVVSLVLALAGASLAPSIGRAADAPAKSKPVTATAKLGYVETGGNTEVLTLLAGDKLAWTTGHWLIAQDADAVYGRDHSVENAGRYLVSLRGDYKLSERISPYALGSWRRNTFGGINRQFEEGVGLVFHAIAPKPQQLDLEGGVGLKQREDIAYVEDDFSTARLAGLYKYLFLEKSSFLLSSAWVVNLKDTGDSELDSRVALEAPVTGGISLTLGYDSLYRNQPLPGFEKTDWTVSAGVQVTY